MNAKDQLKQPIRGWTRPGGRRGRWIEPFLLLLIAEGPPRRECRLTAKGEEVLDEWVEVMVERRRLINAFLERSRPITGPEGS